MAHAILIPPVIPSAKVYYRMHRLRLKKDKVDLSHRCGVVVGLLKKQGMRRTYLLYMIMLKDECLRHACDVIT